MQNSAQKRRRCKSKKKNAACVDQLILHIVLHSKHIRFGFEWCFRFVHMMLLASLLRRYCLDIRLFFYCCCSIIPSILATLVNVSNVIDSFVHEKKNISCEYIYRFASLMRGYTRQISKKAKQMNKIQYQVLLGFAAKRNISSCRAYAVFFLFKPNDLVAQLNC